MDTRVMRGDSRARVFVHLARRRASAGRKSTAKLLAQCQANFRWTSGGEDVESSEFASSF